MAWFRDEEERKKYELGLRPASEQKVKTTKLVVNMDKQTNESAARLAARVPTDERRDEFIETYRSHIKKKSSPNYQKSAPTLTQMRSMADASILGGIYTDTRAKYNEQRTLQNKSINTLNSLGVTDFGGTKINWNTISFDDAIRTIRLIPDANARKTALTTLKDMTKDGGRFSRYSAYDFGTSANAYIANSDFDMADYEEFFEGGEFTRGVEGSFSAVGGDSEENRAKYEEFLAEIDGKGLTDWQKQWYVKRLDDIYYQTTGVKYQPETAASTSEADAIDTAAASDSEKPKKQKKVEKPDQNGDVWKALGVIIDAERAPKKDDLVKPIDTNPDDKNDLVKPINTSPDEPAVRELLVDMTDGSKKLVEGVDYTRLGEYASATMSSGVVEARPEDETGTVNLVGDPVRAAEYVLAGRGNELDEETRAYIDGLMKSSTAANAILGGWHYNEQELANRVLYGEDGAELDRYVKMFNSGLYQDNDISYIIGGRLGGYYNKTRSDTFPAELTSDVIGMILGVAMDAEEAYRNGQINYNPAEETYYDAYLRQNPQALANLDGAFRSIYEMQKEKREQDQLVADAAEATRQEQIASAREAVRTGDYDAQQYQIVVDNAPVMTDLDLKMDPSYVDYNADIRAYVYDAYDDEASWIHREVLDCLEASGNAGADMHSNAAISYLDMLHASVDDQLMNDLRVAKSLGYEDLASYYQKMGGFSVERLADRAKISLQELDAQIDPDAVEYISSFTGTDDTHWGGAMVAGAYVGIRESQADRLQAIWALDAGHREDRPYYEQQMRQAYGDKYGYSLSAYMYKQDMLAFAEAHPSAEMGQYIREYIESGADVFRLAIKPEMTWSLNKSAEIQRKADAVQSWAESTYAPSMEGTFNISKAGGANFEMQATAIVVGAITRSAEAGVAVGFGLPQITQETEAQLAEGKSMKYASTMGLVKGINTVLAESATSGALTKKALQIVGITPILETAGNAISNSRVVNAMYGMIKNASGQIWDEVVVDNIKDGTGWQVLGKMTEEMMSGSGVITSLLAGIQNIDVGETLGGIDMKGEVVVMLPNIFISGLGGAMEGWKATRQAAQKVAQTGSSEAAREFVEAFASDVVIPENRAELDEACEAMSTAVETVGRMMTDTEITPTVETSMAETEQADAHAQEAASSRARMDADMQTMEDIQARMDAGEINPDLPAMMGSAAADYSKANQGLDEHTREEAQKRSDADRHMGEAFAAAKTKAGQTHEIQKQQLREAMSEMAVQAAERARETEVTRLQDRISSIEAQMQAEFDKGDDADFDLINNLAAQSGALSAYLEDMTAQEDGQADAEQIRSDVARRLDEIEQAREARVSAETQAVMETRERTRKLIEEQDALGGVFKKLRNDVIYVDETQAAEILYELGAKSLTEANRILGGTKLTKTKGSGTPLDGSYYAELKALAPGYFREEWDAHPESAIVSIAQRRIHLRADIDQSKQDEKAAQEAYRAKSAERYSGVSEKAAEIPPGYALSQFENENIQTSEVSTDTTNELLAGTTHEVHTHKSLEEKAAKRIADNGLKRTVADLMKLKNMSDEDIVTGKECLAILKRNGDLMRHAVLSVKLGIEGTKTGQALNVFSLFQKRSAENAAAETLEMANAYNKKKGRYAKKMDEAAMDEQLSLGETQYQPFLEERVSFGTSDPAMQKLASDVAKRSGLTLYWANMPDGMRGFFMRDKGVIVLNQKVGAAQGAYIAAIHEYTHFMEQAEQYGEYADVVLKAAYGKDYEKSKAMLEDAGAIRDAYAERGEELTDDLLRKELVASATEKILLGDEAFMRTLFTGGNGGVAVRMLGTMDRFLRSRKADDQASKQEYELIEAARVKVRDAIANAEKFKTEAQNGPQYSMQVERSITPGGDRQQAISDTDTYDQITASAPDGEIVMQEQPDVTQTEIRDPAEYDAKEVTRRVIANIEAMQADDVNADNEWGVMMNQFQRDKIDEFKLHGVTLPGLNYNRATVKQRMLCAILATPQDRVGPNGDTLTRQLKDLEAGKLAVVTEADYNYILSQAAIVEGSAVDEVGVPLAREGEQAFGRMKDAQANIQPVSLAEKTSAWRYISLLSSPVTTIKNIDGNLLIQEAERISTMGAAWIDKMVAKKTGMRTTDTATREEKKAGTQAALERGRNAFDDYFVAQTSTSRSRNYNAGGDGRVFQNNALETVRNVINFAMDAPDQMFMEKTISEELSILKRIEAKVRDEETGELRLMTEGEMYEEAYRRASERFYHDNNRMVEIMNNLYNIPGVGTAMRVLIPFAKTPSNIALRMFDYSPLGLAKSILYDGLYAMNHAKGENGVGVEFDQRRFVMGMSRGMTGTMVTIAGVILFNSGILEFGREDEENKKRRDVLGTLGRPYSMYINIGDTKHEIAFTMPSMAGLAVGAGLADRFKNKEGLYNLAMGVVSDQVNQLFDNSYLSSINDIFRGYGEGSDIFFNTLNTLTESYTTQMLSPSMLRAFAKAADPYTRDTVSSNGLRQMINETVIQNWPIFRQMLLPIKYDLTGDAMTQHKAYDEGGAWENAAMHWMDSLLSPTATYSDKDDPALWELLDLSYRGNTSSVLPAALISDKERYLTITKTDAKTLGIPLADIQLTDEQKRWVNQQYGYILFNGAKGDAKLKDVEGLREIIASDMWAEMDDGARIKYVENHIKKVKLYIKAKTYEAYGKE